MTEAIERVRRYLGEHVPETSVQEFGVSTATAPLAAEAVGCELGAIVKSLLFLIDGRPILALVAGDVKADDRKLAGLHGVGKGRVKIADAETVAHLTGYAVGGVPPVAHASPLPILIDETLQRFATVYAAAGAPHALFAIALTRLIEVTRGQVVDLAKT